MWIPARFLALLAAQATIQRMEVLPLEQPSDVLYCHYKDTIISISPKEVTDAQVNGMKRYYKDDLENGYPMRVSPTKLNPVPKWNTPMLQHPVPVSDEARALATSPIRVVFTEPTVMYRKGTEKVLVSSFWGLTYMDTPGGKLMLCDTGASLPSF